MSKSFDKKDNFQLLSDGSMTTTYWSPVLSPGSDDRVPFDGSELGRQEEISICRMLNPALFGFFMGAIIWVRAGTVIHLRRVPILLIDFALFVMIFCGA
jgi:hypothetical protein